MDLLPRGIASPQYDGTLLYENRTRGDTISHIQKSISIAAKSSKLTGIIDEFLSYEEHYFRYAKKRNKLGEYPPDDICEEMDFLQTKRARISAIGKGSSQLIGRWFRRKEITNAHRIMALLEADLVTFPTKYFDKLPHGALKSSPYAIARGGKIVDVLVSNATDIIDAVGRNGST